MRVLRQAVAGDFSLEKVTVNEIRSFIFLVAKGEPARTLISGRWNNNRRTHHVAFKMLLFLLSFLQICFYSSRHSFYICVCVCLCVQMNVCMYVCMCVCLCVENSLLICDLDFSQYQQNIECHSVWFLFILHVLQMSDKLICLSNFWNCYIIFWRFHLIVKLPSGVLTSFLVKYCNKCIIRNNL